MTESDTGITDRGRSDSGLCGRDEINRRIAENTGDCVTILTLDGRMTYVNVEGLRLLEIADAEHLLNREFAREWEEETRGSAEAAVALARAGGRGRFQAMRRTASGRSQWWDVMVTPIAAGNGAVVELLAIMRDITDGRREEAFRAAQHQLLEMIAAGSALPVVLERLVLLIEQQADGMLCSVLLLDEDGIHARHGAAPSLPDDYVRAVDGIKVGPGAGTCGTAMHLATRVIVTDTLTDPLWEDYRELARRFGLRACWSMPILSSEQKVLGSLAMYYTEPRTPRDDELELIETAAGIARAAIEQQRAQQALRQSEARNQAMLRAIPDWMFLTTVEGVFVDYHAREPSKLHAPPTFFLGRRIHDVLPPSLAQTLADAFARAHASDEPQTVEYTLPFNDVERFYEASIVRCDDGKILSIVRDVTDRRRAELEVDVQLLELAHLSRVAMLGEISGALAHELSQPLTAVLNNAQAARHVLDREPVDVEQLRAMLDDIIRSNKRAGAVIDRLRTLLRKGRTALQPIDMNDVAREVLELARSELISRRITALSALTPAIPAVQGDHVQLQQVVLNLVLNACDAMRDADLGRRHLTLATVVDDGFVQLVVSDSGRGIAEDQLSRIFEPFFTLRVDGLGLGLAISRSIVIAHGGSIRAENNTNGGATFRCLLPAAPTAALQAV